MYADFTLLSPVERLFMQSLYAVMSMFMHVACLIYHVILCAVNLQLNFLG